MVVYCISRWGEQIFIVTLVLENFSRERLGKVRLGLDCDKGTFHNLVTLLYRALIQGYRVDSDILG